MVITATGETPVAEEVPDTEEIPVISADQPAEGTPVAEEVPGTEEVPGSEEVIVTEEVPVTGETPVIFADQSEEEIPGPEEISVAGEESAGNVIAGAEDRQAEELTEKLRTRRSSLLRLKRGSGNLKRFTRQLLTRWLSRCRSSKSPLPDKCRRKCRQPYFSRRSCR